MVRRPSSFRPSVCKLLRKSLLLPHKWADRDQTCTRLSPGERPSRMCSSSRSRWKVTWYQHIWNFTKKSLTHSLSLTSPLYVLSLRALTLWSPLHSPSSIRQLDVMSKSWNELYTPSLTVWFDYRHCRLSMENWSGWLDGWSNAGYTVSYLSHPGSSIFCMDCQAISRGEQNRYGWRRRTLLTARLIKFYGGG